MKQQTNTNLLAIVACLLWASAFTVVKIGLKYSPPVQFAGLRFVLSGLILLPLALRRGSFIPLIRDNFRLVLWISLLQTTLQYGFYNIGMSMVPASLGSVIIGAGPLFIAIMAHFMMANDKMTLRKNLIIWGGLTGVILVNFHKGLADTAIINRGMGIFLLILVNISGGLSNILVSREKGKLPAITLTAATMLIGGITLIIASVFIEGIPKQPMPPEFFGALIYLSLLSAVAMTIWFALLNRREVPVSNLNFWKFLIPVAGSIIAWMVFPSEHPDLFSIAGICITAAALILLNRTR